MARELTEEQVAKRNQLYYEELAKPLRYVSHDCNAHDDPKLQDLRDDHGFAALGRWWLLVELLGGREGHRYDLARPNGWRRLSQDLEFGRNEQAVEECKEFVDVLFELDLVNRELFANACTLASDRIDRNAREVARDIAGKRFATWCRENRQD